MKHIYRVTKNEYWFIEVETDNPDPNVSLDELRQMPVEEVTAAASIHEEPPVSIEHVGTDA